MGIFVAGLLLALVQNPSPQGEVLLVRGADGWELVCDASDGVGVDGAPAVVPLASLSEVVARAVAGPDGFEFATLEGPGESAQLEVSYCIHAVDHQVLQTVDGPVVVGPPILPRAAADMLESDVLPRLARQDLMGAEVSGMVLDFGAVDPRDMYVVLVRLWGDSYTDDAKGARRRRAVLLAMGSDTSAVALEHWARPPSVDQLFAATVTHELDWRPLALATSTRLPHANDSLRVVGEPDFESGDRELVVHRVPNDIQVAKGTTATLRVRFTRATTGGCAYTHLSARSKPDAQAWLVDAAATHFGVHFEGPAEQLDIRPTMGPGAAFGDVELDGWCDLYVVQGAGRAGSAPPTNRIYANRELDGRRAFVDSTATWGGADTGAGMGALFFDADGDRDLDLYVANQGADVLFANQCTGHTGDGPLLVDISASAGVGGELWSAGICAGDIDNDGDLDLYIASYLEYDESKMPALDELDHRREDPVAMLPFAFPGQRNTLLVNESTAAGIRFVDRTAEAGVLDEAGRGMQPLMFDFDRDGNLDLFVPNDVSPNVLYKGRGDGTFNDISFQTGMDDPRGCMGVALGDVDLDGDEDLFVSNWELEANALYIANLVANSSQRHRVATFRDGIVRSGLGPYGVGATGWGAVQFDLENDGDLDLFIANGYTSPDYESTGICVAQPDHLFIGDGAGHYTAAFERIGAFAPLTGRPLPSRAVVPCDFDRDGDVDLFVTSNNSAHRLLENRSPRAEAGAHWLGVRLRCPAPNTYGIGAFVEVETDRRTFVQTLLAGTSYLAGNPPELHFGLGEAERIVSVVVHLASNGGTQTFGQQPLDSWVELTLPE